ncbi:MAG TPA: hybrid sensor histidine kinase/response regulator [Thermoanaerobaculia bacterium]|nr:hybrid sensor histidine kinase/response regulator [Thermoanaerobaculia bacterium]
MPADAEHNEIRVLVLAPVGRDGALAARVLHQAGMATTVLTSLPQLRAEIGEGAGAVLITEEVLTPEAIDDLAEIFRTQLPWSDLPVLVFFAGEGRRDSFPPAVRKLGEIANITLLDRPTRKVTLVSSVRAALRARRRQYEVRELLLELEASVRQRDQFLAMLSHELRNPLAAIVTAVNLMRRRAAGSPSHETEVIERQAELLSRLVDDLLDVSRVTLGKVALAPVPTDVREVLERCIQSLSSVAQARGVRTAFFSEEGERPVVRGDPLRLEQIFGNLLTNAIKYTPPGGTVTVSLASEGGMVQVRVSDTGVGIDADVLPRIFEPFTQASSTLDRAQGGLGIGLTLVRNLAHLHHGTVTAESAGRGKGSSFVVRLPIANEAPPPAPQPEETTSLPPRAASPRRILVVEDNLDLREGLKSLLEEAGHEVLTSADGEDGVRIALSRKPDVLLIDIGLPKLDGYSVAVSVRAGLDRPALLVAITGYGLPEDRRRALAAGFDDHLTKPVSVRAVLELLDRLEPAAGSLERDSRPKPNAFVPAPGRVQSPEGSR